MYPNRKQEKQIYLIKSAEQLVISTKGNGKKSKTWKSGLSTSQIFLNNSSNMPIYHFQSKHLSKNYFPCLTRRSSQ